MSSTQSATSDVQQTAVNGPDSSSQATTPPLLPAFLITGLLLAAIIFIIVWRHLIERRNARREAEDPTWPAEAIGAGSGGGPKGPTPKLWELRFSSDSAHPTWGKIMPLSATALRAPPKPRRPRYLVPSDRPISFLTRTFGGDRRPPRPPISLLAGSLVAPPDEDDEDLDPIDRLQVAVLVSLPHPGRVRRHSFLPEDLDGNVPPLPPEENPDPLSPCKGKKRSLETPPSDAKSFYYEADDAEGPSEVAFGTVILPFTGDESRA